MFDIEYFISSKDFFFVDDLSYFYLATNDIKSLGKFVLEAKSISRQKYESIARAYDIIIIAQS